MARKKISKFDDKAYNFEKIVAVIVIAVLVFLLFYFVTYSWFGESEDGKTVITVGDIDISVTTDLSFENLVLEPNKVYEKSTTIVGSNKNTHDALVKCKLETDLKINNKNLVYPVFTTNNAANWIVDDDGIWYYYVGFVNKETTITFNNQLQVVNTLTNAQAGEEINISLTVYAIQKDYNAYEEHEDWKNAPQAWKTAIAALLA